MLLTDLLPAEADAWSLLALIAFQQSRSAARVDAAGELVPLAEQDRSRWNRALIVQARDALGRAVASAERTPLLVQGEIAAVHASAQRWEDTRWGAILALYTELMELAPSPVVALNRAVAVAMAEGPTAGLATLDAIAAGGELHTHHLHWSVRADCLARLATATPLPTPTRSRWHT